MAKASINCTLSHRPSIHSELCQHLLAIGQKQSLAPVRTVPAYIPVRNTLKSVPSDSATLRQLEVGGVSEGAVSEVQLRCRALNSAIAQVMLTGTHQHRTRSETSRRAEEKETDTAIWVRVCHINEHHGLSRDGRDLPAYSLAVLRGIVPVSIAQPAWGESQSLTQGHRGEQGMGTEMGSGSGSGRVMDDPISLKSTDNSIASLGQKRCRVYDIYEEDEQECGGKEDQRGRRDVDQMRNRLMNQEKSVDEVTRVGRGGALDKDKEMKSFRDKTKDKGSDKNEERYDDAVRSTVTLADTWRAAGFPYVAANGAEENESEREKDSDVMQALVSYPGRSKVHAVPADKVRYHNNARSR